MKSMVDSLNDLISDPSKGLPEDVFIFVSTITPMINVDLLIKNEKRQTLLTWRDDGYYPAGWHIPGGIIRYKETIAERIIAVAAGELGAEVTFSNSPLALNEAIDPFRRERGHFISLLYECELISPLDRKLKWTKGNPKRGEWAWHDKCPAGLIPVHEMYREYIRID